MRLTQGGERRGGGGGKGEGRGGVGRGGALRLDFFTGATVDQKGEK